MNRLIVSLQHSINTLAARGWSGRRIARELDINRETVARHIHARPREVTAGGTEVAADSKPAISTLGSEGVVGSKPAISTLGSRAGRTSDSGPFSGEIEAGLHGGLSLKRIHQDLVSEHAFTGSYQSVKRFARQFAASMDPPFRRMECGPGEEMQVDFGCGAWVVEDGRRRRPHLYRCVLSHSRKE